MKNHSVGGFRDWVRSTHGSEAKLSNMDKFHQYTLNIYSMCLSALQKHLHAVPNMLLVITASDSWCFATTDIP